MKTKLIFLLATMLALATALLAGQTAATRQIVAFAKKEAAGHGIDLRNIQLQSGGLAGPATLRWKNIQTDLQIRRTDSFTPQRFFNIHVGQLDVSLCFTAPGMIQIRAQGIRVISKVLAETLQRSTEKPERLEDGIFSVRFPCSLFRLRKARKQAGALFHQLLRIVRSGKTPLDFSFQATALFEIRELDLNARIVSDRQNGMTFLRMSRQDLLKISAVLEEELTEAEIRILSERPMLAPQLLQIRNYARHTAYKTGRRNAQIPKDAYRHILWSYLLTREFGEQFAKEVTDAHENNPVMANTDAQRLMDYHNNSIGRAYAKKQYQEENLLSQLMKDPAVVRYSK